jgi:toxin ParE1/3/4
MKLIFSPESKKDLLDIAAYIATENPKKSLEFINDLEASCKKLEEFPSIGVARPELEKDSRMLVYNKYLIFYYVSEDQVVIDRFLPGSRDLEAIFENKKPKFPTKK